jgi:hypothetical protein
MAKRTNAVFIAQRRVGRFAPGVGEDPVRFGGADVVGTGS